MKVRNISKKPIFIGAKEFIMENDEMKVPKKFEESGAIDTLIEHGYLVEVPDIDKPGRKAKASASDAPKAPAAQDASKDSGKQE